MSIAQWLFDNIFWFFLALVLLNFLQRRHGSAAQKKRFATLYLAIAVFLIQLLAGLVAEQGLDQLWLIAGAAVVLGALILFREHTFPFRLTCAVSGERLDFETILYKDSNTLPQYEEQSEEEGDDDEDEGDEAQDDTDEAEDEARDAADEGDGADADETRDATDEDDSDSDDVDSDDIDERDETLDDHDTPKKSRGRSSDGSDRDGGTR